MNEIDPATLETGHILRDWNARDYLDYYYAFPNVPDDEAVIFRFVARGLADLGRQFPAGLDLGCGPVLHHAAQAIPWVDRLDMADYQDSDLRNDLPLGKPVQYPLVTSSYCAEWVNPTVTISSVAAIEACDRSEQGKPQPEIGRCIMNAIRPVNMASKLH